MSGHQLPSFISWQWELSKTWTSKCPGRARDVVGMFFQPSALMFSCFEGVRRLTVVATVTVNSDTLYAHVIKRGADRLHYTVSVRKCVFKRFRVYTRIIWSLGRDTIEIQAWFLTNTPPAVTVLAWPWMILLSFTFLSEIYYLLLWLVFYGLMTSNRSHHQGQLQLHPLCHRSSKRNFLCCLWEPFRLELQVSQNLLWL